MINLRGRKGSEKYYLIISLILGLMVMTLIFYFIFHEYFTEDEIDWQSCRQSILLRSNAPDVRAGGIIWEEFKTKFPLKCKTQVINIDYRNVTKAEKEIANTLVSCWALVGNGNLRFFPGETSISRSYCLPCARIHFQDDVKDFYVNQNGVDNRVDLERMLMQRTVDGKVTYYNYLQSVGKTAVRGDNQVVGDVKAFIGPISFDANLDYPYVRTDHKGNTEQFVWEANQPFGAIKIELPKYYDMWKGDIVLGEGQWVWNENLWISYNFIYFPNDKSAFSKYISGPGKVRFIDGILWDSTRQADICDLWDGIPA